MSHLSAFLFEQLNGLRHLASSLHNSQASHSYSQCGEDLIVHYIFANYLRIQKPTYLDIGAHHPTYLSNTYYFYLKGCRGVCVEPDPILYERIQNKRKKDICLNVGVGISQETTADFYIMSEKTLNTFSKKEAERYQSYGRKKIEAIIKVPLLPVDKIIADNFTTCPNFVSLDVEGLDLSILQSLNFNTQRPKVWCIETLTYVEDKAEEKIHDIIRFMQNAGYFVYADTFINTIFVDERAWSTRA